MPEIGSSVSPVAGMDPEGMGLLIAERFFAQALRNRQGGGGRYDVPAPASQAPSPTVVRSMQELPAHLVPTGRPRHSHRRRTAIITSAVLGFAGAGGVVAFRDKLQAFLPGNQSLSASSLVIPEGAAIVNGKTGPLKDAPIASFKVETTAKTSWNFTSPDDPTKFNGVTDLPAENMFRTTVPWDGVVVLNAPYDADPAKSAVVIDKATKIATVDLSKVSVTIKPNPSDAATKTDVPPFFDRIDCQKDQPNNPYETCIANVAKLFTEQAAPLKEFVPPNLYPATSTQEMAVKAVVAYVKKKYEENQVNMIQEVIGAGLQDIYSGQGNKTLVDVVKLGIKKAYGLNDPNTILQVLFKGEDTIATQGDSAVKAYLSAAKVNTSTVQLVTKATKPDQPDPVTTLTLDKS
jgi:hypothetical protein